jgi:hypothetical protein
MQAAYGHAVKNKAGSQISVLHFGSAFQIGCGGRLGLFSDGLKSLPRGFAPYGIAAEKNQGGLSGCLFCRIRPCVAVFSDGLYKK